MSSLVKNVWGSSVYHGLQRGKKIGVKILFQAEVEEFEYLDINLALLPTNVLLAVSQKMQDMLKKILRNSKTQKRKLSKLSK